MPSRNGELELGPHLPHFEYFRHYNFSLNGILAIINLNKLIKIYNSLKLVDIKKKFMSSKHYKYWA